MIPVLFAALRQRMVDLHRAVTSKDAHGDSGMGTLETAVIAVGVLGLAILLVSTITSAVTSRLEGIE